MSLSAEEGYFILIDAIDTWGWQQT